MIKRGWPFLILVALSVVILLPPLIHGYIYPTGGDDTALHLRLMASGGLPDVWGFFTHQIMSHYGGTWLTGVVLKWFPVPLTQSFMWFNYAVLIGLVWSNYCVFLRLFNRQTGVIVALASFLIVRTNVDLFLAGQIFNIVNMGIILPWLLYFLAKLIAQPSVRYAVIALFFIALFDFWHASGVYLLAIIPIALVVYWQRARLKTAGNYFLAMLGALSVVLLIMSLPIWHFSADAGRQGIDGMGLLILGLAALVGWKLAVGKSFAFVSLGIVVIGAIYELPIWFRYTSAIQPVDKQAIAYIKTLHESTFYGNEYLAYWVYEPYVGKTYLPDSAIYVWRSKPETAMTSPDYIGYWNPQGKDTAAPERVKSMKTFADKDVAIYVAEVAP